VAVPLAAVVGGDFITRSVPMIFKTFIMTPLMLHSLLRYSQHNIAGNHCCSLLWDLHETPAYSVRHTSGPNASLVDAELSQHATLPPVTSLDIKCGIFPAEWPIHAYNPRGVTIRDVLQAIHTCLQLQIRQDEWDGLCAKQQDRVNRVFDARWRLSFDPQRVRARGVLRIDCLLQHIWFAGLTVSLVYGNSCILKLRRPR